MIETVLPDTGFFVDSLRVGRFPGDEARERGWRPCYSAVVHSELVRGQRGTLERRAIAQLARSFRPVAPTPRQWELCGEILGRLQREHGFDGRGLQFIQNDLLIALTARDLGFTVVTTNPDDFKLFAPHLRGLRVVAV